MKIEIEKDNFIKGLYLAQGIADKKNTIPVLANVLIKTENDSTIICSATDLRISVISEIKGIIKEEGGISLGAKYFYEIIKNISSKQILLEKEENNWAEIKAGKTKFRIIGMSEKDFPRLPNYKNINYVEIDAKIFKDMICKTIFSISLDDTRRHLSGIFMEWENNIIRMVSTDGHRLSKIERDVGNSLAIEKGIIIPRKGIIEIKRLLEDKDGTCEVGIDESNFYLKEKDNALIIKMVDAQFPPYQQVIPKENEKKIIIERLKFYDSLKRMSIISQEKNGGVTIILKKDTLKIITDNPDIGEAEEEIDIDYSGKELSIGFNAKYFIDFLNEIKEEKITLEFNGELDPGIISLENDKNYIGVVMPMRI